MKDPISDMKALLIEQLHLRPDECRGKTIVVTGAGRGIGLETARGFALLGGRVILAEISTETGKAAEARIRAEGGEATFVQTDVAYAGAVQKLAEAAGTADILVNNAIRCPAAGVTEMDVELWDEVIAVNLRGTFLTCKTFLPGMIERKSGVILNMVSTDAMPGLSAYIASKQGIAGFSQSLALEVAQAGVKVVPFGPGMVDTPGIRGVADNLAPRLGLSREQFLKLSLHSAYEGLMPAEHAGAAAVYLALRLADEFHGLTVDGYEVLERAGFLHTPVVEAVAETPSATAAARAANLKEQIEAVAQMVAETGQEFEKLPAFVRPIARSGFKSKAGMSLDDWKRGLADLAGRAGGLNDAESQAWCGRLEKLTVYFRGVPQETARFTRDAQMLREVAEISARRVAVIEQLKEGITR